ncbi:unnamed protein product [Cylindrotheca closterium]|uniref:Uncharacterized protein n=1 Tax=Cylindrotheca closterium TaxID=2856 RepID=A0AAD2GAP3_9STRA|nr:unnamed protein product [Cylindrotheca closterium]
MPQENNMASEKDQAESGAKKPLNEEESDGTASDDSSEKDADSDEKIDEKDDEDDGSISSEESKKKEKKVKKTKKDKKKKKKKDKKDKKEKDKKEKEKDKDKDKKKKKLPPVVAPDYVHVEEARSHHSRVSAITIPRALQKIAKHKGAASEDPDYPLVPGSPTVTLPKMLTIGGGGGDPHMDDSQRSARISLLSNGPDEYQRSTSISLLENPPDEIGDGVDTSLLDDL